MKRVWEDVKKKAADEPLIRIVDDEDEVRESLGFMLECEGFRTASYASGAEFLRDFDSGRPGVVLLDVRMPELSGPELQQRLNAMHSKVPVVFITSYSDIQAAIDTLKAGAADFLLKPVDPEKLITLVRILTERFDPCGRRRRGALEPRFGRRVAHRPSQERARTHDAGPRQCGHRRASRPVREDRRGAPRRRLQGARRPQRQAVSEAHARPRENTR